MASQNILTDLSKAGIEYAPLFLTETGFNKSICDATQLVRGYFESNQYHFYEKQGKGGDHKVIYPATYIGSDGKIDTDVRMYRPKTKKGDPRIWFGGIKKHLKPNDLLILIIHQNKLHVFNATQKNLKKDLFKEGELLHSISSLQLSVSPEARNLMESLNKIYKKGFIDSLRKGDTGVGYTLETLLGIKANSSKKPDINGIELKASRLVSGKTRPKSQLFTKTPNWKKSPYSAWGALTTFGYPRGENLNSIQYSNFCLRCTMASLTPNSQGLILEVKADQSALWARNLNTDEDVFLWGINQLKKQLADKHNETFWVGAETRRLDSKKESFRYSKLLHTRKPSLAAFERLLESGGVTIDLTMKAKNATTKSVRDHGYIFKVKSNYFREIFPVIQEVSFSKLS